jgi:CheY-like chemotaxis protein
VANLDLSRFAVLLAEDNPYVRVLLFQCLKALGVGIVRPCKDGGEAMDVLRALHVDPNRAGVGEFDMIVANWQMAPVDGLGLLRWVRRHQESPARFVPFIMVTGYADRAKVEQARDMGATEVLAKPFSVQTLAERLSQVIDRPRQFVHTFDYFGPDRRRGVQPVSGHGERRTITETEIEVVYD